MKAIFSPSGILAQHLPHYEVRAGQREMAEAVAQLLDKSNAEERVPAPENVCDKQAACLIAEAETGLGKTLAYLIPAVHSGRKVVVSTNTRNLQDQLIRSEIPLLQQYLAPNLKAMCVKGRQNYLCLYRWHQLTAGGQQDLFAHAASEHAGKKHGVSLRKLSTVCLLASQGSILLFYQEKPILEL